MHLVPLLAETSKTPFYIAAGILVVWAIVLAALGLARGSFSAARPVSVVVIAVSVLLVVATMAAAVGTASKPEGKEFGIKALKPLPAVDSVGTSTEPNQQTRTPGSSSSGSGGSSASSGGGAATRTLKVAADPSALKFDTGSLTAKAGKVTIDFDNPAPIPHDVRVEASGGKELGGTKEVSSAKTTATVNLKPGTYTYFCSVPGHREAGMEGQLTVK
jgi:plastocyanin